MLVGLGLAFSLSLDAVLAYLAAHLTSNDFTDTSMTFLVYFGILVVGQFTLGLYASLKRGALLFIYTDKEASGRIARMLDQEQFPRPHVYDTATMYLTSIMDDQTAEPTMRIRAGYLKGELDGYGNAAGFIAGIRMTTTWDDAIKILATERNIRKAD